MSGSTGRGFFSAGPEQDPVGPSFRRAAESRWPLRPSERPSMVAMRAAQVVEHILGEVLRRKSTIDWVIRHRRQTTTGFSEIETKEKRIFITKSNPFPCGHSHRKRNPTQRSHKLLSFVISVKNSSGLENGLFGVDWLFSPSPLTWNSIWHTMYHVPVSRNWELNF